MSKIIRRGGKEFIFVFLIFISVSCNSSTEKSRFFSDIPVADKIFNDKSSVYYAQYEEYPEDISVLPIGMFDSGTGGLTVLEQFLAMDKFNNETGEEQPDGIADFDSENFSYLADQANMPYGLYDSQNAREYLRELIIKDALFLTSEPNRTKFLVIACNTATAYGLGDVEKLMEFSGTGVKVIGVIDAGVSGAFEGITSKENAFGIGVLATVGTIASGGYERSIREMAAEMGYSDVRVVNQGGLGFAEAVDMEPDYISATASDVRDNYRGPVFGEPDGIREELMTLYNFDLSGNSMLVKRDEKGTITDMQLNSAGNYARFHLVTLLDNYRKNNQEVPIKSIIMGCTHYPYLLDTLTKVTEELRDYSKEGVYPFISVIDTNVSFIDPAVNTAKSTYRFLMEEGLLNKKAVRGRLQAFISVPHPQLPDSLLDEQGSLMFDFKYGRDIDSDFTSVSVVPFSYENLNIDNLKRIEGRLPYSYSLIKQNLE